MSLTPRQDLLLCLCYPSRPRGGEGVPHCGGDAWFPEAHDVEHLFICLLATCSIFFGEMSIQIAFPFVN